MRERDGLLPEETDEQNLRVIQNLHTPELVLIDSRCKELSEMSPLATKTQVGESLFHQVISQMTNARFDLRGRHSLFC